ncbi:unnamed protein product [Ophioblennius macclurei]
MEEVKRHVLSAARTVMDMVEREWEPLSGRELELRLDQAVEHMLESQLRTQMAAQLAPPPTTPPSASTTIYLQLLRGRVNVEYLLPPTPTTEEEQRETAGHLQEPDKVHGAAVQHISDLLQSSTSRVRLAGRARLSLSHTVLLSLTLLSERLSYRCVSRRFRLEKGNIHRIFFSFCQRVNALQGKIIRWPRGRDAEDSLLPFSHLLADERDAPRVLGVLGHTRVPICLSVGKRDVKSVLPEVRRMQQEAQPDSWLNLELVCNCHGRFLHCRVSRGSDAERGDTLVDELGRNPELMLPGAVLVAPTGYPLTARVLTPYDASGSAGPREQLFNEALDEHLRTFDQAVANLRARFPRLRYLDIRNYERARAVALAACVLHNIFIDIGQAMRGTAEKEETQPRDGEADHEGVQMRDTVAELLFTKTNSGSA